METCIVTARSKSRKIWANSSFLAPWRGNGKRKVVALLFTPFCLGHQCLDERPCAVWFLMACIKKHLSRGGTTVHSSWCFLRGTELQKALQRPGTYFLYLLLEMQRLQKRLHCSVRWKGNSCWCRCRPGETCPLRTWWSQLLLCSIPSLSQTGNLHILTLRKHSLLSSFLPVSILRERCSPASPFPAAQESIAVTRDWAVNPSFPRSARNLWKFFIFIDILFWGLWFSHENRYAEQKSFPG